MHRLTKLQKRQFGCVTKDGLSTLRQSSYPCLQPLLALKINIKTMGKFTCSGPDNLETVIFAYTVLTY